MMKYRAMKLIPAIFQVADALAVLATLLFAAFLHHEIYWIYD